MADVTSPFGAYGLKGRDAFFLRHAQALPANWLGRRLALLMRRLVLSRGYSVVDAAVEGIRLRLYMSDNVSERKFLFLPQFFDAFERKLLHERLKQGDVFVDIGANAGIYSMTAASIVGNEGRVLSIEPNPAVLERLKFNASLNGFTISTEQAGVSDSEGTFDLCLDDTNLGGSSLVAARSASKITVSCHLLSTILRKHGISRIDALKIDIEGAEDKALIPFFQEAPLDLHPKIIILENSAKDWKQDLVAALGNAGYRLLKTTRMNMVWEKAPAPIRA